PSYYGVFAAVRGPLRHALRLVFAERARRSGARLLARARSARRFRSPAESFAVPCVRACRSAPRFGAILRLARRRDRALLRAHAERHRPGAYCRGMAAARVFDRAVASRRQNRMTIALCEGLQDRGLIDLLEAEFADLPQALTDLGPMPVSDLLPGHHYEASLV